MAAFTTSGRYFGGMALNPALVEQIKGAIAMRDEQLAPPAETAVPANRAARRRAAKA